MIALSLLGSAFLGTTIPPLYRGHWTTDLARCGGEDVDGVVITASTVTFYEARGTVRHSSRGAKGMSAKVTFEGEGRTWTEGIRLHPLGSNRLELTALGGTSTYLKCPAPEAELGLLGSGR